jgi:nucleotide-binding universal stress UspA family protein
MTTRIVLATDFSDAAEAAAAQAYAMARALSAEVIIVHVAAEGMLYRETPFGRAEIEKLYESQRAWARAALDARLAAAREAGLTARVVLRAGAPAEEIVRVAEAEQAAMIVIGTHGRSGFERLMLGSVADRVIRSAACPVLTVRERRAA